MSQVVKRQRQAPKQELKLCGARLLIKPALADPSNGLELIILFFEQRDWNSSLKFGQLTAKWLESSVSDLQMKQRTASVFESRGTPPFSPNCPVIHHKKGKWNSLANLQSR